VCEHGFKTSVSNGNHIYDDRGALVLNFLLSGRSNALLIRINAPRIKKTAPLAKLMLVYQNQIGAPANTLRFVYDNHRIAKDDTPMKLKMEEVSFIYFCKTV
jgi:hypothetical protein